MPNEQTINDKLQLLKLQYLDQLQKKKLQIQDILTILERDNTLADTETLRALAHKLAGTGGTYGYHNITEMAKKLEIAIVDYLQNKNTADDIIIHTKTLIKACDLVLGLNFKPSNSSNVSINITEIQANRKTLYKLERENNCSKKPLILLIEDDENIINYMIEVFKRHAHILIAVNEQEAENMMIEYQPNLVFLSNTLDYKIVGLKLLEKFKQTQTIKHIPIMMVTSNYDTSIKEQGLAAGLEDFIYKPFVIDDILAKANKKLNFSTVNAA